MLVPTNGVARYNAGQPLLSPHFIFNKPFDTQNDFLRHHRPTSSGTSNRHHHRLKPLRLKKNNNNEPNDTDSVTSIVERVSSLLAAPTPGIVPNLALGYPLLLATTFLFFPIPSAALLLGFFTVFSLAGRKLIQEDYLEEKKEEALLTDIDNDDDFFDKPRTDLLALGSAILCTALFDPDTGNNNGRLLRLDEFPSTGTILVLLAIFSTILVLGANSEQTTETVSPQQKLMQLWDDQLAENTDDETQGRS
ncbi:unnamed protein product [Cylindrotheca closterium]|uniref:Uncharacterized protein n=1 Tax=Cylindrotheca closterium TaxID=2856 RepID=A0AAD2FYB8_9STRA|nr:unnamed protein product [Cylindrotheca closterium]